MKKMRLAENIGEDQLSPCHTTIDCQFMNPKKDKR